MDLVATPFNSSSASSALIATERASTGGAAPRESVRGMLSAARYAYDSAKTNRFNEQKLKRWSGNERACLEQREVDITTLGSFGVVDAFAVHLRSKRRLEVVRVNTKRLRVSVGTYALEICEGSARGSSRSPLTKQRWASKVRANASLNWGEKSANVPPCSRE